MDKRQKGRLFATEVRSSGEASAKDCRRVASESFVGQAINKGIADGKYQNTFRLIFHSSNEYSVIDFNNIHLHSIPPPQNGTVFGSAADFDALPETHKAQILFLDKTAEKYLYEFVENARMLSNGGWAPFENGNFKTVDSVLRTNRFKIFIFTF